MTIQEMTRKDFESLPLNPWNKDIGVFTSLVILPSQVSDWQIVWYRLRCIIAKVFAIAKPEIYEIAGLHDSGYRCMEFVACKGDEPICRLSGCSDVIYFDGIGGYGYKWATKAGGVPDMVLRAGWCIDCLPQSGLLRIFSDDSLRAGAALSTFEIYYIKKEDDKK